ncbi:hypothetical protein MTBUT4_230022 [Magnetospirillum sp. UT-4]|nr:hypothetical protein MTBUT4_230022 [Magnetospirillum sp. UT-4]
MRRNKINGLALARFWQSRHRV